MSYLHIVFPDNESAEAFAREYEDVCIHELDVVHIEDFPEALFESICDDAHKYGGEVTIMGGAS